MYVSSTQRSYVPCSLVGSVRVAERTGRKPQNKHTNESTRYIHTHESVETQGQMEGSRQLKMVASVRIELFHPPAIRATQV